MLKTRRVSNAVRAAVALSVCALLPSAFADGASRIAADLFSVSFASYAYGEALSDAGAVNGTWGEEPTPFDGWTFGNRDDDRMVLDYETDETNLVFATATDGKESVVQFDIRVMMQLADELPELESDAKAAFTVADDGEGNATFWGWTATGWKQLYLPRGAVPSEEGDWYVVRVRLRKDSLRHLYVQYQMKANTGYAVLKSLTNDRWFGAAGDGTSKISKVELQGAGSVGYFNGIREMPGLTLIVRETAE